MCYRYEEAAEQAAHVLELIAKQNLTQEERDRVVEETVQGFRDHVNPGFLEYRKSVSNAYAAVEWSDGGTTFQDIHGRTYIDCLGGFGIYNVGHRHPKVVKAVTDQLRRQALHSQDLLDPLRAMLARLLATIAPGRLQYAFFTNSGTESVEGAMKLARLHTGRKAFIAATRGFHGKSLGSLSVTAKASFRQPFLPLVGAVHHVPFGDADVVEKILESARLVGDDIAAVVLEPIQGEGGVIVPPDDYLPRVRELCTRYGALLILDEVQTGLGRTGKLFACEHYGVEPDILCLAKALGGGVMPIGAFLSTAQIWQGMIPNPFLHTTTFGGNPLACAAAIATISVTLEERLWERAAELGEYLLPRLRQVFARYPGLGLEVRGKGLLIGMEFQTNEIGYQVAKEAFDRGVLLTGTLVNSKTIRVEPPLTISREELDRVVTVLDESLQAVRIQAVAAAEQSGRAAAAG